MPSWVRRLKIVLGCVAPETRARKTKSISTCKLLKYDHCVRFIHSFIYSRYFYSASSSPLILRGASDYSVDTASEFHAEALMQATASEGLAQGPKMAARVRFETTTLKT